MKKFLLLIAMFVCFNTIDAQDKMVDPAVIIDLNKMLTADKEEHILPNDQDSLQSILLEKEKNAAIITLHLSKETLSHLDEEEVDEIIEHLLPLLPDFKVSKYSIGIQQNNQFRTLESFLEPYEEIVIPISYNTDK